MTLAKDPKLIPFTDAQLVEELVARNGYDQAPSRTTFAETALMTLVALSADTTAYLTFHEGDLNTTSQSQRRAKVRVVRAPVTPHPRSISNALPRET